MRCVKKGCLSEAAEGSNYCPTHNQFKGGGEELGFILPDRRAQRESWDDDAEEDLDEEGAEQT